jgi:Domain of unknown function (DUF4190)
MIDAISGNHTVGKGNDARGGTSMAATDSPETTTTREPDAPRATASPLDQHAPPTASTGGSSGRATASLILGIISIPAALIALLGIILGVIALVLGATARGDIRRRGLSNSGHAMAGMVLGSIGLVLGLANMIAGVIIATN